MFSETLVIDFHRSRKFHPGIVVAGAPIGDRPTGPTQRQKEKLLVANTTTPLWRDDHRPEQLLGRKTENGVHAEGKRRYR